MTSIRSSTFNVFLTSLTQSFPFVGFPHYLKAQSATNGVRPSCSVSTTAGSYSVADLRDLFICTGASFESFIQFLLCILCMRAVIGSASSTSIPARSSGTIQRLGTPSSASSCLCSSATRRTRCRRRIWIWSTRLGDDMSRGTSSSRRSGCSPSPGSCSLQQM
jgi:hypothetical protein